MGGDGDNVTISTIIHHLAVASARMWGCKWGEGNGQGEMCSSGHNDDVRSTTVHLSCHHHCYMAVVGTQGCGSKGRMGVKARVSCTQMVTLSSPSHGYCKYKGMWARAG